MGYIISNKRAGVNYKVIQSARHGGFTNGGVRKPLPHDEVDITK